MIDVLIDVFIFNKKINQYLVYFLMSSAISGSRSSFSNTDKYRGFLLYMKKLLWLGLIIYEPV